MSMNDSHVHFIQIFIEMSVKVLVFTNEAGGDHIFFLNDVSLLKTETMKVILLAWNAAFQSIISNKTQLY